MAKKVLPAFEYLSVVCELPDRPDFAGLGQHRWELVAVYAAAVLPAPTGSPLSGREYVFKRQAGG
jgi:hypothetical protein